MANVVTYSVDPEKYKKSSLVAAGAMLQNVTLARASVLRQPDEVFPKAGIDCEIRLRHRMVAFRLLEDNLLAVEIEGLLEFLFPKPSPEAEDKILGNIALVYEVRYAFPEGPFPEGVKEGFPDFGEINGLYNIWPYLRARMQDLSSEMGIPVVLPTLRIAPRKPEQKPEA